MKFYSLKAAVKAAQVEKPVEAAQPKKQQRYRDTFSKKEKVVVAILLASAAFVVWYCAALMTFALRYGNKNSSKVETCLVTNTWALSEGPVSSTSSVKIKYFNKNRVTPREFNARFWGSMFFQKYPKLEEQAEPEWSFYQTLNPPYYKWITSVKTVQRAPFCHLHQYWHRKDLPPLEIMISKVFHADGSHSRNYITKVKFIPVLGASDWCVNVGLGFKIQTVDGKYEIDGYPNDIVAYPIPESQREKSN